MEQRGPRCPFWKVPGTAPGHFPIKSMRPSGRTPPGGRGRMEAGSRDTPASSSDPLVRALPVEVHTDPGKGASWLGLETLTTLLDSPS